jgi:biotin transport system substrate-specific component
MTETTRTVEQALSPSLALRRAVAVVAGAVLVALGAQAAVPIPGTPVPLTLQVPAVLIVGGLLGPSLGASSLVFYLMLGATGLPVFAPGGLPGVARLFGPTGGYLLAYPLAAAIAGLGVTASRRWGRLAVALVAGTLMIHVGGVAQLAVLGGDPATAWRLGSLPFLLGDFAKLLFAGLIVGRFAAPVRRALH